MSTNYAVAPVGLVVDTIPGDDAVEAIVAKLDEFREETAQIVGNDNPEAVAEYGQTTEFMGWFERTFEHGSVVNVAEVLEVVKPYFDRYAPPGCEFGDDGSGKWGYWPKDGFVDAAGLDEFEDDGYVFDKWDRNGESSVRDCIGGQYAGWSSIGHERWDWKSHPRAGYALTYLQGSDYSGCLVERSNYEAVLEMLEGAEDEEPAEDMAQVAWAKVSGSHGSFGLFLFRRQAIPAELYEVLVGLHNYPLLDEERHSRMELDAQAESWDNGYRYDFKRALEAKTGDVISLDDVSDEAIDEFFEESREAANEYWVNESGDGCYIDLDPIVEGVTLAQIRKLPGARLDDHELDCIIHAGRAVAQLFERDAFKAALDGMEWATDRTDALRAVAEFREHLDNVTEAFDLE